MQCPLIDERELLNNLLESDKLHLWHESEEGRLEPQLFYSRLDYHGRAYEKAEHYLRNSIVILAQESDYFGK